LTQRNLEDDEGDRAQDAYSSNQVYRLTSMLLTEIVVNLLPSSYNVIVMLNRLKQE
jgi:hypothetical protein